MKIRLLLLILGVISIGFLLWRINTPPSSNQPTATPRHDSLEKPHHEPTTTPPKSTPRLIHHYHEQLPELENRTTLPNPLEPRVTRYNNGTVDLNAAIERSKDLHQSKTPSDDLQIIQDLLTHYRYIFKTNPVGSENAEFTTALLGNNAKQVVFIDPKSPALSPSYELLDRWGTPFFMHAKSGTELEVISAGADRKLWTKDDVKAF